MKKAKELRDQSIEELESSYLDSCKELYELKNQRKQESKMKELHLIPLKKKEIARLLTILHEKKTSAQHQHLSRG